ncbi:hypothetical protein PspLS_02411 [Pyricularia sp. CBS 133598]|nr:hypothetical protein PspLS_02411 [Pyricularia sp. CBS 133598]
MSGMANSKKRSGLALVQPTSEKRRKVAGRDEVADPPRPIESSVTAATQLGVVFRDNQTSYPYPALRDDHILIVHLKPSKDPDADIVVELRPTPYSRLGNDNNPDSVIALSYNWGNKQAESHIIVADGDMNWQSDYLSPAFPIWSLGEEPSLFGLGLSIQGMREDSVILPGLQRSRTCRVKLNLFNALRQIRDKNHEVLLWVDALCINQMDNAEKDKQVGRMWEVYSKADHVLIWLGSADARTDRAMEFIPTIVKKHYIKENLICREYAHHWADLLHLMRSTWFSRRWVIQELALARNVVVQCGAKKVHWHDFSDAIGLFSMHNREVSGLLKAEAGPKDGSIFPNDISLIGATILVDEVSKTFHRDHLNRLYEPQRGLETLVSVLSTFDTTDPRDTIFTLLNIARGTCRAHICPVPLETHNEKKPPPSPDYKKDLFHVYAYFVRYTVKKSQSLNIICRQWALEEVKDPSKIDGYPEKAPRLPTWICTRSRIRDLLRGRQNGDSLVGLPGEGCYNASHGMAPEVEFGIDIEEAEVRSRQQKQVQVPAQPNGTFQGQDAPQQGGEGGSHLQQPVSGKEKEDMTWLRATGIRLAVVGWRTDPIADGVIPRQALYRLGWGAAAGNNFDLDEPPKVQDRLWRTLIADRTADGRKPNGLMRRACERCLVNDTPDGHINTKELLLQGASADGDDAMPPPSLRQTVASDLLVEIYLRRVQAVTWNRVVLEAVDGDGLPIYGIGPPDTREDDLVVVLFGCSVPVILREKVERKKTDDRITQEKEVGVFEFVGEVFIFGKMDGEAVTRYNPEELKEIAEAFKILDLEKGHERHLNPTSLIDTWEVSSHRRVLAFRGRC